MLSKLKKKVLFFLKTWRLKDTDCFKLEIPFNLEGETESIVVPGKILKVITDVELEITVVKKWSLQDTLKFYCLVLDMYFVDELTESNIRMFLHPEVYESIELFLERGEEEGENNRIV